MSLKKKAFSAVRWTAVSMLGRAALQFLQLIVLARFLIPEDFGLIALVVAVVTVALVFSDMGVSSAIIHHQIVQHEVLSSLFWLNVLVGSLLMLLFILLAPLAANFYQLPVLRPILILVSVYFLINAFGQQLIVVAEKNLHFALLAKIELSSATCSLIAVSLVAWKGGGAFSIVAGMLVGGFTSTVLAWRLLAKGWRPAIRMRLDEIRPFLGFGAYMIGQNVLSTLNAQADVFIGSRVLSANSFGMYSLPRELGLRVAGIINPIITRVGFPVMAKSQHDQAYLKTIYLKILRMTASVNFPIYMAIVLFAPEIVALLFGERWEASIPLLQVLAVWGMLRSVGNPAGSLVFAVGRADLAFKWNLALIVVIPPILWFGAKHGAMGMALASMLTMLGYLLPAWYVLIRPLCGAGFGEYFQQLLVPFLLTLISALAAFISAQYFSLPFIRISFGLAVGSLCYLMLSRKFNQEWFEAMIELLSWKKAS